MAALEPSLTALTEAYMLDRYPGFDFEDPDRPAFGGQFEQVIARHTAVEARVTGQTSAGFA